MYAKNRLESFCLWLFLAGGFVLGGCGGPETKEDPIRASGPQKSLDPAETGPYTVGVTTLRLTDPARKIKQGESEIPRPMVVEIWYPAEDEAAKTPKDKYIVKEDAPDPVKKNITEKNIALPDLPQNAHRDAKLLRTEGPYPLILFSHGSGGIRYQSVFQCAHLASHGYIVVSADHVGNTLYELIAGVDARDPGMLVESAVERPKDMVFLRNEMLKRNADEKDLFYQSIQPTMIGITGHSFGGLTSILATSVVKDLKVSIPQAPHTSFIDALGITAAHIRPIPFMILASKTDLTLDYEAEQRAFYLKATSTEYHQAERTLVTFNRGGHFTFSNICEFDLLKFASSFGFKDAEKILNDGCAATNIPTSPEGHRLINRYATAMFNVHLRKSEASRQYIKQAEGSEIALEHKDALPAK